MKKLATILFVALLGNVGADASLYRSYQTEDGLSHNSVWAAMQDSRGFMWFGTNDGLNRFDGLNFKVYRRCDNDTLSLGNNFVHCLLEDKAGRILVGTKEGLYCYNYDSDTFRHISLDGHSAADDKSSIHCLSLDKDQNLWVGCYGQGVYRLDPSHKVERHFGHKEMPSQFVTAMALDISGDLWVGTDDAGLFRLDTKNGKTTSTPLSRESVQSIYRQSDNTLWLGTSAEGLFHYNPLSGSLKHIRTVTPASTPVYNVKAITPYRAGELVMGSEGGLLRLDCSTEELTAFNDGISYDNLPDNSIFAIAKDNEGALWLGTYFYGVSYRSPRINAISFFTADINDAASSSNIVKRLTETPYGNILLTTRNLGIAKFDTTTKRTSAFPVKGLSDNVQGLLNVGNNVWISDYERGIVVADYPSARTIRTYTVADGLPSNIVNSMYRTSRGDIYVGTSRGACRYADGRFERLPHLQTASVMKILEDYSGNVWFATHFHGLFKLSADGDISNYSHRADDAKSLPGNNINNIFLDSGGMMWVGTEGEGLAMFNPATGAVERRFTEADGGIPSNIIYSTIEDMAGNLWVSTGGGLVKLSADGYRVHDLRYIEKLLNMHYMHNASLRSSDGNTLYFGGSGGFISFNPADITENDMAPTVCITDLYVNGRRATTADEHGMLEAPISKTRKIELEASQSTFSFDVACLSYLSPEHNSIAYILEGFDKNWKTLSGTDRHIAYMNIPSGDYTLKIKGANNDGVWGETVELDVTVKRSFLLSNSMLAVYVLLLLALLYYIKRRMDRAHKRKLVEFSHAKEKELYNAKIGFFTNIAHEIRTPLSLISAPLETILKTDELNERTRRNLSVMRSNVGRLLELVNQLLDFRKVESQLMQLNARHCSASEIVLDICNRYREFADMHTITLDISGVESGVECNLDAEAFAKIVGNLMSNAIKFADKNICVTLHNDTSAQRIELSISDDGPGIKDKYKTRIFESFYQVDDHGKYPGTGLGLPLAQSLAHMHGGEISVESDYGHGSRFIVSIPTDIEASEPAETSAQEDGGKDETAGETDNTRRNAKPNVLVVEDNDELRQFITDNLGDSFNIIPASNGIDALKALEDNTVDIIVSDIMMPDMDGIELCRAVRGNDSFSHLPLVLLSAKTDVETKIEGLNFGADAYIEKPFSLEQLRAQINTILENRARLRDNFIKSPLDYYKKPHVEDTRERENAEFVEKLNTLILDNLTNPDFNIDNLARMFYMSRSNFHKRVKGITGKTPNDYIRIVRLIKSAELLATGEYQIVEVCYMVGFNTPSYFSKCFFEHFGQLPKDYISKR